MLQIHPTTMAEYGPDESSTDSAWRPSPPIYDAHTALELRSQYTEHARDWATSEKILSERPSELSVIAGMGVHAYIKLGSWHFEIEFSNMEVENEGRELQ